jgi:hypothetical protein
MEKNQKIKPIKVNNWSIRTNADGYTPPEAADIRLIGEVLDHPKLGENKKIQTSSINEINGRTVYTKSGSVYILGRINPEYRKWLKKNSPNWNWRKPVRIVYV